MAVFTRKVVGEGQCMWQKRFSAFCFPLERGVAAGHNPGSPTLWPYCLTQTVIVKLGRKRYVGASVFIVTNVVVHCKLLKSAIRRVKKKKLHNFQRGEETMSKELNKQFFFFSFWKETCLQVRALQRA